MLSSLCESFSLFSKVSSLCLSIKLVLELNLIWTQYSSFLFLFSRSSDFNLSLWDMGIHASMIGLPIPFKGMCVFLPSELFTVYCHSIDVAATFSSHALHSNKPTCIALAPISPSHKVVALCYHIFFEVRLASFPPQSCATSSRLG